MVLVDRININFKNIIIKIGIDQDTVEKLSADEGIINKKDSGLSD